MDMERYNISIAVTSAILVILLLSGCTIASRAGGIQKQLDWPPERTGDLKTISLRIDEQWPEGFFAGYERSPWILSIFHDSKLFWKVSGAEVSEQTDLIVDLSVTHTYTAPCIWGCMRVLTGFLIPLPDRSWTVTVEIEVRDSNGRKIGFAGASETEKSWFSILFLPIIPFTERVDILDLSNDTIRAAITNAHEKGLF